MPRYDWQCGRAHSFEEWADRSVMAVACPHCDSSAQRQLAVPLVRGPTVNPPAAVPKSQREVKIGEFMEAGEQLEYEHTKNEQMVGHELKRPDLTGEAKRRAQAGLAGKRAPPEGYTVPSFEEEK